MRNEFIPYKEALALKELGFDEPCFYMWNIDTKELFSSNSTDINGQPTNLDLIGNVDFTAPLYQQAFRWFREKHNLESIIEPRWKFTGAEKKYCTEVFDESDESDVRSNDDIYHTDFNTYEEAELACLIKLIEIINQNKKEKL